MDAHADGFHRAAQLLFGHAGITEKVVGEIEASAVVAMGAPGVDHDEGSRVRCPLCVGVDDRVVVSGYGEGVCPVCGKAFEQGAVAGERGTLVVVVDLPSTAHGREGEHTAHRAAVTGIVEPAFHQGDTVGKRQHLLRAVLQGLVVFVISRGPFELVGTGDAVVLFGHDAVTLRQVEALVYKVALVLSVIEQVPRKLIAEAMVGRSMCVAVEQAVDFVSEHVTDAGSLGAGTAHLVQYGWKEFPCGIVHRRR